VAVEGVPRALLVDGEGVLADEISGLLQAQGAQVVVVPTPAEALIEARQNPVHLVVLNPLEWGEQTLQLVESLREEARGRAPFLLFTEPGGGGQHVLSRLSSHLPSVLGAPHEYSWGEDTSPNHDSASESHALRDLCARLDEILHHHSTALDNGSPDAAA
jgi:CheY-like chemotaxis protein